MPYQERPQFAAVEQGNVGEKVVLEGVKVGYMFDLAQGNGWTRQDFKVEKDGCETKVKYWRPEKVLSVGQIVTVVGVVEEYQGKKSLSIDAKKGGGVAEEGEPLAYGNAPTQPAPQPAAAPSTNGQNSFLIFFYDRVLTKMKLKYTDEQNAASATHSVMIAYHRRDANEEELERWLSGPPEEEDIPF